MKIKKILLPYDGSNHSHHAAEYAIALAKCWNAHITVVHCFEEWDSTFSPEFPGVLRDDIVESKKQEAEEIGKEAEAIFQKNGVECSTQLLSGEPGIVLTKLSQSKEYDLIIMGSSGHSDIAGLILGSVTHKVINTMYCPVLIVP